MAARGVRFGTGLRAGAAEASPAKIKKGKPRSMKLPDTDAPASWAKQAQRAALWQVAG
jgi:hypothetical protein